MVNPAGFIVLGVGGFCIGVLIGLAIKAAARILMYVAGLYLASLLILSNIGIITVNWAGLAKLLTFLTGYMAHIASTNILTSTGAFGVATTMGILYGAVKARTHVAKSRYFRRVR